MATLYFTTNADSGSGSLRQALANAAPGEPVAIPAVGDNPTTRFFRIKIQIALP